MAHLVQHLDVLGVRRTAGVGHDLADRQLVGGHGGEVVEAAGGVDPGVGARVVDRAGAVDDAGGKFKPKPF